MIAQYYICSMGRLVSNTEFAKLMGLASENSVRNAIKKGRLKDSVITQERGNKLDLEVAIKEWKQNENPRWHMSAARINEEVKIPILDDQGKEVGVDIIRTGADYAEKPLSVDRKNRTREQLDKEKLIIEIEIKELDLAVSRGEYIKRNIVDTELANFGVQVRSEIMSIPQRIVDSLMACTDRHEMVKIMSEEFTKSLIMLTNVGIN